MPIDEDQDPRKKTFNELLALQANQDKSSLVLATIQAFKDGEPSAIKLVTQALLESQFSETNQLPITNERFEEIVCLIADHMRAP